MFLYGLVLDKFNSSRVVEALTKNCDANKTNKFFNLADNLQKKFLFNTFYLKTEPHLINLLESRSIKSDQSIFWRLIRCCPFIKLEEYWLKEILR